MTILIATVESEINSWHEAFTRLATQFDLNADDIECWPNVANKSLVEYLVVWKPPYDICTSLPHLKAIFNLGAGVDHLLLDDSLPKHVPIMRVVDDNLTRRMGEYILLQTLYHLRSMPKLRTAQRHKKWLDQYDPHAAQVNVGIMGLGEIGSHCVGLLRDMGFNTYGWSNSPKNIAGVKTYNGRAELDEFLNQVEILINLLPHTANTDKLVDYAFLKKLKSDGALGGASYIAAGRGKTHVENDLLRALNDGCLKSASMDVFEQEPLPASSPLWTLDNLVITPHIAAASDRDTVSLQILQQIATHKQGGKFQHIVDLAQGY